MSVYLVTDIFGITSALLAMVNTLNKALPDSSPLIHIIDPYQGQNMNFEDEAAAYAHFTEEVGLEKYTQHLYSILVLANKTRLSKTPPATTQTTQSPIDQSLLLSKQQQSTVIGFSMGASAIWALSDKSDLNIDQAFYFYGSQIRHSMDINPIRKGTVILPISEPHFDVNALQLKLEEKNMLSVIRCAYYHGFMNLHSTNFNQHAYNHYTHWLSENI